MPEIKFLKIWKLNYGLLSHALVSLLDLDDKRKYYSELLARREEVWSAFFKMDHQIFQHKKITFDYRLLTDGLATSLQFVSNSSEAIKTARKLKMREGRDRAKEIRNGEPVVEDISNVVPNNPDS